MRCSLSYIKYKVFVFLSYTLWIKYLLRTTQVCNIRDSGGHPDRPSEIFFFLPSKCTDNLRHTWFRCQDNPGVQGKAAVVPWWHGIMIKIASHPFQTTPIYAPIYLAKQSQNTKPSVHRTGWMNIHITNRCGRGQSWSAFSTVECTVPVDYSNKR